MDGVINLLTALLLAVSSWFGGEVAPAEIVTAKVVEVIDGDTIEVSIDGNEERVRYIGVDTPEFDYETGEDECLATEAKSRNEELVGGKSVSLVKDVLERDDYGRLLRYVEVDGRSVGETLVREGLARAVYFEPDTTSYKHLREVEGEARASGAGLWSVCN